jgi:hypothetical protein
VSDNSAAGTCWAARDTGTQRAQQLRAHSATRAHGEKTNTTLPWCLCLWLKGVGLLSQPARGGYDELVWMASLFAAARIRASSERPDQSAVPAPTGVGRARAPRDLFAAAGIHDTHRRLVSRVSISWSARAASRHSSHMSPRRASSQPIVSIAAMVRTLRIRALPGQCQRSHGKSSSCELLAGAGVCSDPVVVIVRLLGRLHANEAASIVEIAFDVLGALRVRE